MKRFAAPLLTPIYAKTEPGAAWPQDAAFYALTSDGLLFCRNHRFYRSAVQARRPPRELASQREFLAVDFPRIPRRLLEQAVGFFDWACTARGAESILLLAYNDHLRQVELIAPPQVASSYRTASGKLYADSVRYETPHPLPDGIEIFGDIHSHCEQGAQASGTDLNDEDFLNGLHIIAGRIEREPPEWHVEAAVDGVRFAVGQELVFEGYRQRDPAFPDGWRLRHEVQYTGNAPPPANSFDNWRGGSWSGSTVYGAKTTWGGKPLDPTGGDTLPGTPSLFPPSPEDDSSAETFQEPPPDDSCC